jgi:hypothetical protein
MATENRDWGYSRVQGALANLGHEVARGTIANILREHGLEPAPERNAKMTWKEFLCRHRDLMVAVDFFTIEAGPATSRPRSGSFGLDEVPRALLHRSLESESGGRRTQAGLRKA